MKHHLVKSSFLVASLLTLLATEAAAQYSGWQHSGSMFILTTPEGADLPAWAAENDFPILVRLNKDFFNFSQAAADGADVRFSTSAGEPLAHQIEDWDAARGTASIWVRMRRSLKDNNNAILLDKAIAGIEAATDSPTLVDLKDFKSRP